VVTDCSPLTTTIAVLLRGLVDTNGNSPLQEVAKEAESAVRYAVGTHDVAMTP